MMHAIEASETDYGMMTAILLSGIRAPFYL